jgi:class 3 adenylate cyclase
VIPDTRYARTSDGTYVAYQIAGTGPVDLVFAPGWFSNVELAWEHAEISPFLRRLSAESRLILFDRRGNGLSDPIAEASTLDAMMEDVKAVMDAAGSERAVLVGLTITCASMAVFAATFPDRTLGVVLIHPTPRVAWSPEYPWGETEDYYLAETEQIAKGWGTGEFERWFLDHIGDPRANDALYVALTARYVRHSMSPGTSLLQNTVWRQTDYRHVLPAIHVPALIIDRRQDPGLAKDLAATIPGARLVRLEHEPLPPWIPGSERAADEILRFVSQIREEESDLERVLATVLFTDVVGSTDRAAQLGDARWAELMESHNRVVRTHLARYRGREIKTVGDGFLAIFDGPARAIRCAQGVARAVEPLGLQVRAGLHTGELTVRYDDVEGLAVAIAARVMAAAGPGEVLVSNTVRDLVAGSGLSFQDRGERSLKGVPGEWRLFAAGGGSETN